MIKFIKIFQSVFPPFCILVWILFCSSCVTTTVYYPVHHFVEEAEKTVKKGVVEFMVLRAQVSSPPPGVITDYEIARERGRKEAYKKIQKFCRVGKNSKFSIQSISTKVKHSGWQGHASSYSGFSTTSISPVYQKHTTITFQCN